MPLADIFAALQQVTAPTLPPLTLIHRTTEAFRSAAVSTTFTSTWTCRRRPTDPNNH